MARHVMVDLFHNGDMENRQGNENRSSLNRMLLNWRERMASGMVPRVQVSLRRNEGGATAGTMSD